MRRSAPPDAAMSTDDSSSELPSDPCSEPSSVARRTLPFLDLPRPFCQRLMPLPVVLLQVLDKRMIATNYLLGWFAVDFATTFDWASFVSAVSHPIRHPTCNTLPCDEAWDDEPGRELVCLSMRVAIGKVETQQRANTGLPFVALSRCPLQIRGTSGVETRMVTMVRFLRVLRVPRLVKNTAFP